MKSKTFLSSVILFLAVSLFGFGENQLNASPTKEKTLLTSCFKAEKPHLHTSKYNIFSSSFKAEKPPLWTIPYLNSYICMWCGKRKQGNNVPRPGVCWSPVSPFRSHLWMRDSPAQ